MNRKKDERKQKKMDIWKATLDKFFDFLNIFNFEAFVQSID